LNSPGNMEEELRKTEEKLRIFLEAAPVGVVIVDRKQNVVYANDKFTQLTGYTIDDISTIEKWWELAYPDEDYRDSVRLKWTQSFNTAILEQKETEPTEDSVCCKDGSRVWIEFRLAPLGELNIVLLSDITARRTIEEELKESEARFRVLAENSPVAIMIYQEDYFVYSNDAGELISGYSREELYKMRFWDFIHPDYKTLVKKRGQSRQSGGTAPQRYDFKIVTKTGEEKWVNLSGATTIYKGKNAGFIVVIDITERKEAVQALSGQLRIERLVSEVSGTLVSVNADQLDEKLHYVLEICGQFMEADRSYLFCFDDEHSRLEDYYEWSAEGIPSQSGRGADVSIDQRKWWLDRLLTDGVINIYDLDELPPEAANEKKEFCEQGIESFLQIAVKREGKLRRVFGFDSIRGKRNWTVEQVSLLKVIAEIISNVISKNRAEKALIKSESRYREILATMEEGYYEVDLAGNFTFFNDSLCNIFGCNQDQLMGVNYKQLYKDPKIVFQPYNRVYKTGIPEKAANLPIATWDGRHIYIEVSITLRHDQKGQPVGFRGVVRDITERKHYEERLKYLSFHDQLTDLYNRAYFDNELNRLNESREYPITVIACDLDGLKLINDTLGHESGDRLLVNCARLLKNVIRSSDMLARVGGDEFAILLPRTGHYLGRGIAKRIKARIAHYNRSHSNLPLSISMGLATAESNDSGKLFETYKEADDLMYRDKIHKGAGAKSQIISSLMAALGERDYITEGHASRLEKLCKKAGKEIGLSTKQLSDLVLLAHVHDLGKVGIPDKILFKKGPLSKKEWKVMETHPEKGHRIASASKDLKDIADLILKHHERWDGQGYPEGIKGEDIPVECRVLAIADAYDAMTSDRPYRKAMHPDEAIAELKKYSGKQFDPSLIKVFLELITCSKIES